MPIQLQAHRASLLVSLAFALAACAGGKDGPTVGGREIGPAGGTVDGPAGAGGAQIVVPAGALASPVVLSIGEATAAELPADLAGVRAGKALALLPHGQAFAVAVKIRIPYDAAAVPTGQAPQLFTAQPGGTWAEVPGVTARDGFLEAEVSHFSYFAPAAALTFVDLERTCGLTMGGDVWCWLTDYLPDSSASPLRPQPLDLGGVHFQSFSAGAQTLCGIGDQQRIHCLGYYPGNGTSSSSTLVPIQSDLSFRQVSSGVEHTCAVTEGTQELWCWGRDTSLQLGPGAENTADLESTAPRQVAGSLAGTRWLMVSTGRHHTCAVTDTGTLYCWGGEIYHQLGRTCTAAYCRSREPVQIPGSYTEVYAGATHTCAIDTGGRAICWGLNDQGQLGDGKVCGGLTPCVETRFEGPVEVAGAQFLPALQAPSPLPLPVYRSLALGSYHTCGITAAGSAACWGRSFEGQLGDGATPAPPYAVPSPVTVGGSLTFRALGAYFETSFGISTSGGSWEWGSNHYGELGNGAQDDDPHPLPERLAP